MSGVSHPRYSQSALCGARVSRTSESLEILPLLDEIYLIHEQLNDLTLFIGVLGAGYLAQWGNLCQGVGGYPGVAEGG